MTIPAHGTTKSARAMMILIVLVIAGAIAIYAAKRNHPASPLSETSEPVTSVDLSTLRASKFEVTYRPETVVIDPATTQKSFEGVSADGAILVFNTTCPRSAG